MIMLKCSYDSNRIYFLANCKKYISKIRSNKKVFIEGLDLIMIL